MKLRSCVWIGYLDMEKKYMFMQGVNASGTHCSQNVIGQTISGGGIDRGCAVCSFCQLPTQITMQRNRDNKSP